MKFIVFCMLLASTSVVHAQTKRVVVDETRVQDWAERNQAAVKFPSLALGIVDRSGSRAQITLGSEPDEAFIIGSLSKSVTALATMLLVDEGALKLDDPVSDYYEKAPSEVTVEMLLHQTSGLDRSDGGDAWTNDASLEEMISNASWGPRGEFSYSNLNYQILGGILEKVSGKSFSTLVEERVFKPLGLENSSASDSPPSNRVTGHQYVYGFPVETGERAYNVAAVPSGFVWMSPDDMAVYLQVILDGGKLGDAQVFSPEVIAQVTAKPETTRYAMGWLVADHDPAYLNHAGSTSAFTAAMAVVPGKWGVYALSNLNTYSALGTVTAMQGLLAMVDVIEPHNAGNAEFVIRLVAGAFTLLFMFALIWRALQWIRLGFPLKIMPSRRLGVAIVTAIVCGVLGYIVLGVGASLEAIAVTQPDLFVTFVMFTAGLILWQMLGAMTSSAMYYGEDDLD